MKKTIRDIRQLAYESTYEEYLNESGKTMKDLSNKEILEWNREDLINMDYELDDEEVITHNIVCKELGFIDLMIGAE